jgi:hypothetical protein
LKALLGCRETLLGVRRKMDDALEAPEDRDRATAFACEPVSSGPSNRPNTGNLFNLTANGKNNHQITNR